VGDFGSFIKFNQYVIICILPSPLQSQTEIFSSAFSFQTTTKQKPQNNISFKDSVRDIQQLWIWLHAEGRVDVFCKVWRTEFLRSVRKEAFVW
jgi:hypothetical protein